MAAPTPKGGNKYKGPTPTKQMVLDLAKKLEMQRSYNTYLGAMNTPQDEGKKIEQAADYRFNHSLLMQLEHEYKAMFDAWYEAGKPQ